MIHFKAAEPDRPIHFQKDHSVKFRRMLSTFACEIAVDPKNAGPRGTVRGQVLFDFEEYNPINTSKLKNTIEHPAVPNLSAYGSIGGCERSFLICSLSRFRSRSMVDFGALSIEDGREQYRTYIRHLAKTANRVDGDSVTS